MRIGYLECFAGLSGDMLLGALVDAGVPPALLQQTTVSLNLGATLVFDSVDRSGISARKAHVLVDGRDADATHDHAHSHEHTHDHHHEHSHSHEHNHEHTPGHTHPHGRNLPAIREILNKAPLAADARALAIRAFELLGQAEAAIHNTPLDQVHFHEVGAVDAIVDITCAAVGLTSLRVDRWYASSINVGSAFVDCAHGRFPVPAPATASLLRGIPTFSEGPAMELVTPTGAAMLRALGCDFTRPTAAFEHIGYGAGTRNPARFPNVVRLSIGEAVAMAGDDNIARETVLCDTDRESIAVLECAIDDLSPQIVAHTIQLAIEHGALDAMAASVVMKKGRLGTLLTILCRPADAPRFEELLFRETSTIGVRSRIEQRRTLERAHTAVMTPYGEVRIKTAALDGVVTHAQPEYEDCHALALEHRVPLKQVIDAALQAWSRQAKQPVHDPLTVTNDPEAAIRE
ncbi:MAG TPA: nickel pincer cofactor biosynthesis protein LarC [Acidobacteriaceae bacterium]